MQDRKRQSAFSLVEVVVSTAILGIIAVYLTQMLVEQSKTYQVVDEVTEAQQSTRALADLLERDLRLTGMLVAEGAAVCGFDNGFGGSDILYVTDTDAVNPTGVNQAGLGARIQGGSYGGAGAADVLNLDNVVIDGAAFYDVDAPQNGGVESDFYWPGVSPGGGVIVTDRSNPDRGAQCGLLTDVDAVANTVTVDWTATINAVPYQPANPALAPLLPGMGAPQLVAVPAHVYWIDRRVPARPRLVRDGLLLADDVEDLQIAYYHDLNTDGVQDPLEWSGVATHTLTNPVVVMPANNYVANALDNSLLRSVRVNLVVRTASQDPDVAQDPTMAFGQVQPAENAPIVVAPADGFRRRLYTRTVRPRNVGVRGAACVGC